MSDTHSKLQYGYKYKHWKTLNLVLETNPKP